MFASQTTQCLFRSSNSSSLGPYRSVLFPHFAIPLALFTPSPEGGSERNAVTEGSERRFPRVHISIIPRHLRVLCFHTLTHSFASAKSVSPTFSVSSKLFAQNTGVGYACEVGQRFLRAAPRTLRHCVVFSLSPLHFAGLSVLAFSNFTDRTIPAPSFTTIIWFGFTSFNVSTAPLGQRISSNSTFSALPIPK
jgi:hypothetical protein